MTMIVPGLLWFGSGTSPKARVRQCSSVQSWEDWIVRALTSLMDQFVWWTNNLNGLLGGQVEHGWQTKITGVWSWGYPKVSVPVALYFPAALSCVTFLGHTLLPWCSVSPQAGSNGVSWPCTSETSQNKLPPLSCSWCVFWSQGQKGN